MLSSRRLPTAADLLQNGCFAWSAADPCMCCLAPTGAVPCGPWSRLVRDLGAWRFCAGDPCTPHSTPTRHAQTQAAQARNREQETLTHVHCIQALRQQCMATPSCSAFMTRPAQQKVPASGWLKTGPINGSCTSVSPYTALYVRQAWPLPPPPASRSSPVGAIVGGMPG